MDDAALIAGLRRGERAASHYVMDRYGPALFRYIYDSVADAVQAEDLVAEALLRMVAHLDQFVPERGTFQAWLFRIAHHVMIDHYRAKRRRPQISLEQWQARTWGADPGAPDSRIVGLPSRDELQTALATLTADQRQVILLQLVADLNLPTRATVLARSLPAVKSLYYRGIVALRRALPTAG